MVQFASYLRRALCKTRLIFPRINGPIVHEQTIICRQLFAGHVMSSWPMQRKKNLQRMIIWFFFVSYLSLKQTYHRQFSHLSFDS